MPPGAIKVWKLCVRRLPGDRGGGVGTKELYWAQAHSAVCALLALPKAMIWEVLEGMSLMTR